MVKDKVFQMFICGTGKNLDYALENNLGGVIFFAKDIKTSVQFVNLIKNIKLKAKTPLFLSIDQEGGRVERTENIHERFLSPKYAFEKGEAFLITQNEKMLKELSDFGLNMNFAPCLDVNTNPNNPIIGERAYSSNREDVCRGWDIVSPIYKKNKIIPVIKHFPGHGDADKDSHKELPQINLSLNEMEYNHIYPFFYAIRGGADFIMVAHLWAKCFGDKKIPTSLNKNCLDYLYKNLNFKGITISDDMYMDAIAHDGLVESCVNGIMSGLNMFIFRDLSDETILVMDKIAYLCKKNSVLKEKVEYSYKKIIDMKIKYKLMQVNI